jgi:hypothetical protein
LSCFSFAIAQDTTDFFNQEQARKSEPKPPFNLKDHLFTGGNFGLQFGTVTLIDVSPVIGYKITPKFNIGFGITYIHFRDSRNPIYVQNIYGARALARYFILPNLFAHAEYEGLHSQWEAYKPAFTIYNFLAGGGYRQAISEHLFLDAMLLWNFTPTIYTPYNNPIIRIGFNLGL